MSVLSKEDLEFWDENGYVIARNVTSRKDADRAAQAVWEFTGMNPNEPETWYPENSRSIMIEIYQNQALWDNRQSPRVHEAFSQIWKTEKLWVSFDRASINPPSRDENPKEWRLHWDMNLSNSNRPFGLAVQGVLYLIDTAEDQGAFTCVPGFHKKLENWIDSLPEGEHPHQQDLHALGSKKIAANAGDLIIWHRSLPHFASVNTSDKPRVAQYITMSPANEKSDQARQNRINWWQERLTGLGKNEKAKEHHHNKTAELTPLGRKLLGLDLWDDNDDKK